MLGPITGVSLTGKNPINPYLLSQATGRFRDKWETYIVPKYSFVNFGIVD